MLARARPSASVRSVTPLAAMGCCSPLSAVGLARLTRIRAPLSIGQHSPAHAPRGRAAKPIAPACRRQVRVVHQPDAQGKGSRRRSSACLAPWPATRWVAQGPAAAAVARALACLCRSSAGKPPVPRRAGAEIPSTRPWPVKCTGQPTQPSNRRPNAPPIAVPHGSLASSTLTGALRSTRRASSKRGAPLVSLYSKGGRSGPARANPNPQRTNQRERPLP